MKKRTSLVVSLFLLIALALPGIANATNSQGEGIPYPLTLTDSLGNEITLDAPATHVVTLGPAYTEILWAIGAGDAQVGRTAWCNYPPEVEDVEVVGEFTADTVSLETIIALEADLVIGDSLHAELAPALAEAGIPLYIMRPVGIRGLYADIISMGLMTDHAAEAAELVVDMELRISAVEFALQDVPMEERVTFYYEVWNDPFMTVSPVTFLGEILEAGGGVNIFSDLYDPYPTVSAETIIDRNPDVILGGDFLDPDIATRDGWDVVTAVQEEAIYSLSDDLMQRAGPRVADAVESVAKTLYPDLFE